MSDKKEVKVGQVWESTTDRWWKIHWLVRSLSLMPYGRAWCIPCEADGTPRMNPRTIPIDLEEFQTEFELVRAGD